VHSTTRAQCNLNTLVTLIIIINDEVDDQKIRYDSPFSTQIKVNEKELVCCSFHTHCQLISVILFMDSFLIIVLYGFIHNCAPIIRTEAVAATGQQKYVIIENELF